MTRRGAPAIFDVLRLPGYRLLWCSVAAANVGRWAITMALGWLLLELTHSTVWTGAVMFALQGPALIGAPLAGLLADRVDRRWLLSASLVISACLLALLAVLLLLRAEQPGLVLALTLGVGLAASGQTIAWNALLPNLVGRERILNAIALQGAARQGAEFIGPALAGMLLAVAGMPAVFVVAALLYLVAALLPLGIHLELAPGARLSWASAAAGVPAGLLLAPVVVVLVAMVSLHCSLTMAFMGVLPLFAASALRGTSATYGALLTAIGLGALGGTLALAGLRDARARGPLYAITAVMSGVSLAALGGMRAVPAALLVGMLMGAAQAMFMALSMTFIQERIADAVRGRVSSLYTFFSSGVMSIASLGYGVLALRFAPGTLLAVGGGVFLALAVALWLAARPLRALIRERLAASPRESAASAEAGALAGVREG